MDDFRDKRVTVLGLGRFGGQIAAVRWLCRQGARVLVTDRDDADKLKDSIKQLDGLPVTYRLGADQQQLSDFTDTDYVVTSPAVKPNSPFLQAARGKGVPITTEICLFAQRCPGRVIGVTGTKGKSTTTALLGKMLATTHPTFVGGNIGHSLLSDLPKMNAQSQVVLELSSYMLHYLGEQKWSPNVAVVTMLAQDHVEWHGSRDAYIDAKRNITRFQGNGDVLVRRDDKVSQSFLTCPGVQTRIYPDPTIPPFDLLIPGQHNQHNAQAAYLASGVSFDQAQAAVGDFTGLDHRLQLVHEAGGVRFFDDSIATVPEAAIIACDAFAPGTVIQIIGGSPKDVSWDAMCVHLSQHCKRVLTIGQVGAELACKCANGEYVQTLENAMIRAREIAREGDVVLLSPGTASYDQFPNFEFRGRRFAELARQVV
jgi:UDP-N-acetylmuramoylalanine--D-glutamate ligase